MKIKKPRSFRLLSKTTFIYLIFTFIAFYGSALFLTHEADEFINNNLDHRFRKSEHRLKRYIEEGKPLERLPTSLHLQKLAHPPAAGQYPVFADTAIYNAEMDEFHRYRKKTIIFEANQSYYRAELLKSVEDFLRLKNDIFGALIPAFMLLAAGIVLFNSLLSGYIFRPFNKILGLMKTYKVGQLNEVEKVHTSTREFQKMQELFHQMIDRIEGDYRHLKEYTENMAHEMRTPLSVIRNKTEHLIADDAVMRRHEDTVKIIYSETNHLSKLSDTLNLLTKIENYEFSDTMRIKTRPVIENHLAAITELAELKGFSIETNLSDEHEVVIDPFLLDIVIKNLLRNAISYGKPEQPIRISTIAGSLSVSNCGPPLKIPPEEMFRRFYGEQNRDSSLGLGLSLVQKICELNDLQIDYRYEQGRHIFMIRNSLPRHS